MKKSICTVILLITLLMTAVPGGAAAETTTITMTDLGTLGGNFSVAILLNEKGQLAGNSETASGEIHGFFWENGQMVDLGTLGGSQSIVVDLNNNGQIVGTSFTESDGEHIFLWQNSMMLDLGPGRVGGISDQGQVTGTYPTLQGERAFLWQDGILNDIGSLGGWGISTSDINEVGQVVGYSAIPEPGDEDWDMQHAFLWQNGILTDLGTLNNGTHSFAAAVNDLGQVVGNSEHIWYDGQWGFLWENGKMIDLGTLGGMSSFPQDINNHGQIAGSGTTIPIYQFFHAFLWENGVMTDLGTLGGGQSFAADINEQGQIVGTSDTNAGTSRAFLWDHGVMRNLGSVDDLCCSWAAEINELGQIVGSSWDDPQAENSHATLWTIRTEIPITIDIKPGSSANPINLKAKGVLPVAVLTTDEFNTSDLDLSTVLFDGASPSRWVRTDMDADGDTDLVLHFDINRLDLTSSSVSASLTGNTFGGIPVEGTDLITVVP